MLFSEQIDSKIEPFKMRSKQSLVFGFRSFARFALSTFSQGIENKRVKRAGVPRSLLTVCAGVQISRTGSTIMARKFSGKLTMNYNIK